MKVLLLSIIAKCGVFTHVKDLALHLQKQGVDPVLGLVHNSRTINIFKLRETDLYNMKKSLDGINYFLYRSEKDLLEQINNSQIDLVHAHSPIVFLTAMRVSEKLDIPLIATLHSTLNWSKFYPKTMEKANCLIAVGSDMAKSVGEEYRKKVYTIFNGVDIERFIPNDNLCFKGPLRILWIGRTNGVAANGAKCLKQAIKILRKRKIPVEVKFIGYASSINPNSKDVYGWVHDPLLYLQWSHLAFGRGRALREAMACGNVGFLIGEGYGGIVETKWFENNKEPQLCASLKYGYAKLNTPIIVNDLLYFHYHRSSLIKKRELARKICEENFDIRIMVKKTYTIYKKTVDQYSKNKSIDK